MGTTQWFGMRLCKRFHFADVEPGDRIFLGEGRVQEFNDERDPDVTITVASKYESHNFGEMIDATNGETYYLNDYDVVRVVP